MWSPIDIFFIAWFCNFSPCQDARLSVAETIEAKENQIIRETIGLRDDI
jgi:hypothetical protein